MSNEHFTPEHYLPEWLQEQYSIPIDKRPLEREDVVILPNIEYKQQFIFTPETVYQITILNKPVPKVKELPPPTYHIPRPMSKEEINFHIPTWQRLTQTR